MEYLTILQQLPAIFPLGFFPQQLFFEIGQRANQPSIAALYQNNFLKGLFLPVMGFKQDAMSSFCNEKVIASGRIGELISRQQSHTQKQLFLEPSRWISSLDGAIHWPRNHFPQPRHPIPAG